VTSASAPPARTIVVTGSASGMGAATADLLRTSGDRVIGVDLRESDVVADLSTDAGRRHAISAVLDLAEGQLDGAVCAAGLGPVRGRERLVAEVNYRGAVDLLTGWRPALARGERSKVVVIGSNSTTTTPFVRRSAVRAFLRDDLDSAVARLGRPRALAAALTYAASKVAVTRWARQQAVTAAWAGAGIRLNVLAPGAVLTPLLAEQLDGPEGDRVRAFPIPIGEYGDPAVMAAWAAFMLSPAADFLVGSFVVVDGGSDAYFRAADWPAPVPVRALPRYLLRMYRPPRRR
jgi:NAD(P)-dependent dehydrogenase (short-subunit alcohol dehydrogenase family)